MDIIVLDGSRNTGKTTTLSMIYATLVSNGWNVIDFVIIPNSTPKAMEDFEALLTNQNKTVAICSYGDIPLNQPIKQLHEIEHNKEKDFNEKVTFYKAKNVDVLIVADSTGTAIARPPKNKLLKTLAKNIPTKSIVQAHAIDCQKIISLI